MEKKASRLGGFLQSRLGDSLRAVGFYSSTEIEMMFVRDDLSGRYSEDILDSFIHSSKEIQHNLQLIDEGMGQPEASLHVLDAGLVIQFHYPTDDLIFFSMERDVGSDLTGFIDECQMQMSQTTG